MAPLRQGRLGAQCWIVLNLEKEVMDVTSSVHDKEYRALSALSARSILNPACKIALIVRQSKAVVSAPLKKSEAPAP